MNKYKNNLISDPAINIETGHEKILSDLQANILKHHKKVRSKYLFLKFYKQSELEAKGSILEKEFYKEECGSQARAFLSSIQVTSAMEQINGSLTEIRGIYLSYKGYKIMGLPDTMIPKNQSFRSGMQDDVKSGFNLDETSKMDIAHAMYMIAIEDNDTSVEEQGTQFSHTTHSKESKILLQEKVLEFEQSIAATNIEIIESIDGELDYNKVYEKKIYKERFGYVDGISNVRFFPNPNLNSSFREQDIGSLRTVLTPDLGGNSYGSFLVFLKFTQDNVAFNNLIKNIAKEIFPNKDSNNLSTDDELEIKAMIMGRYPKGAPISQKDKKKDYHLNNNFSYDEYSHTGSSWKKDSNGLSCPFFSHIRKANPRKIGEYDGYNNEDKMVRRGVNYVASNSNPNANVVRLGLLFMSFQRDINKQFEKLVTTMLHNPNSDVGYSGSDILTGKMGEIRIHRGNKKCSITPTEALVTLEGGAYFFAPSISFFRNLKGFYPPLNQDNVPSQDRIPSGLLDKNRNIYLKPIFFGDYRDDILKKLLEVDVLPAENV